MADPAAVYAQYVERLELERVSAYASFKAATVAFFLSTFIPLVYGGACFWLSRDVDMTMLGVAALPVMVMVRFEVFAARRHHNILKLRESYEHAYTVAAAAVGFKPYLEPAEADKMISFAFHYLVHHDPSTHISARPGGDMMSLLGGSNAAAPGAQPLVPFGQGEQQPPQEPKQQ
jgi:hypothetical protein